MSAAQPGALEVAHDFTLNRVGGGSFPQVAPAHRSPPCNAQETGSLAMIQRELVQHR